MSSLNQIPLYDVNVNDMSDIRHIIKSIETSGLNKICGVVIAKLPKDYPTSTQPDHLEKIQKRIVGKNKTNFVKQQQFYKTGQDQNTPYPNLYVYESTPLLEMDVLQFKKEAEKTDNVCDSKSFDEIEEKYWQDVEDGVKFNYFSDITAKLDDSIKSDDTDANNERKYFSMDHVPSFLHEFKLKNDGIQQAYVYLGSYGSTFTWVII